MVTHESTPLSSNNSGTTGLTPVIALLSGEAETGITPMKSTHFQGVIEAKLEFDPLTHTYHLWYWVNGFTPIEVEPTTPAVPTSTLRVHPWDPDNIKEFDPENWWIVPNSISTEDYPGSARVYLHTTGQRVTLLDESDNELIVLVTKEPTIVNYWPTSVPEDESSGSGPFSEVSELSSGSDVSELSSPEEPSGYSSSSSEESASISGEEGIVVYIPTASRSGDYLRIPKATLSANLVDGSIKLSLTPAGFDDIYVCCEPSTSESGSEDSDSSGFSDDVSESGGGAGGCEEAIPIDSGVSTPVSYTAVEGEDTAPDQWWKFTATSGSWKCTANSTVSFANMEALIIYQGSSCSELVEKGNGGFRPATEGDYCFDFDLEEGEAWIRFSPVLGWDFSGDFTVAPGACP